MSAEVAPAPRALVHRGHVEVAALWFAPALLGEAEARRRVLEAWTPGGEVLALEGGYLVRLPTPARRDCARAPGLPFTREDGVLLALPLTAAEWRRLAPAPDSVVWSRAGEVQHHALGELARVDVSAWLEVSEWEVVPMEPLSAPPPPVAVLEPRAPSRESFGVGAATAEAERMRARMEGRPPPRPLPKASPWPGPAALWKRLVGWWRHRRPRTAGVPLAPAGAPVRPPISRLLRWLYTSTPLASWIDRQQGAYLRRLMELFSEGHLEEALRHAIPLSQGPSTEEGARSLARLSPREVLSLTPRLPGGEAVLLGTPFLQEMLKERYRAAFQKLEREGRIEEAAFVLADLLREASEAVSFLERHGRLRLAAELAEGRGLAPGMVVRQWARAGDLERAGDVARRTGAFRDGVYWLERTHPAEARPLRRLWAEVLAQAGHYQGAVEAVWPLEEERERAWTWLLRGGEAGGTAGARMLARAVVRYPERYEQVRPGVLALMEVEGPEEASARYAFAHELAKDTEGSAVRGVFLRRGVRELLRDRAAGHVSLDKKELARLVQRAGDGVLAADLPALPPDAPARAGPVVREFGADVGGPWPIEDAVPLGDGRVLVALGELGARLLTRDGRCVAHFDVPAFSLVLSWRGNVALAVAPRGSLRRVSRLDLIQRRARTWCDVRADTFASEYDGERWFIAQGDAVLALDVLAEQPRALWRVDRVGVGVRQLSVGARGMSFVCQQAPAEDEPEPLERWFYEHPELVLRSRQPVFRSTFSRPARYDLLLLRPTGESWIIANTEEWSQHSDSSLEPPFGATRELHVTSAVLEDAWTAVLGVPREAGEDLWLRVGARARTFEPFVSVTLRGAHPGGTLRQGGGELVFFDRSGWLVRVDLVRRAVHRIIPH